MDGIEQNPGQSAGFAEHYRVVEEVAAKIWHSKEVSIDMVLSEIDRAMASKAQCLEKIAQIRRRLADPVQAAEVRQDERGALDFEQQLEQIKDAAERIRTMSEADIDGVLSQVIRAISARNACIERLSKVKELIGERLPATLAPPPKARN